MRLGDMSWRLMFPRGCRAVLRLGGGAHGSLRSVNISASSVGLLGCFLVYKSPFPASGMGDDVGRWGCPGRRRHSRMRWRVETIGGTSSHGKPPQCWRSQPSSSRSANSNQIFSVPRKRPVNVCRSASKAGWTSFYFRQCGALRTSPTRLDIHKAWWEVH